MKTQYLIISLVALFFVISPNAESQYGYNYGKAQKILHSEFFKGKVWSLPSDSNDVCYFFNKAEARKMARIKVIPVMKIAYLSEAISIKPDYSIYIGMLYKGDSLLCPLYVSYYSNKNETLSIYMSVGVPQSAEFSRYYIKNSDKLMYATLFGHFFLYDNTRVYIWNDEKKSPVDYTDNITKHLVTELNDQIRIPVFEIDTLSESNIVNYKTTKYDSINEYSISFQSFSDTVYYGSSVDISADQLIKLGARTKNEPYSIWLYGTGFAIWTKDDSLLIDYLRFDKKHQLAVGKLKGYSSRLVEIDVLVNNKRKIFSFQHAFDQRILLTASYAIEGHDHYLALRIYDQNSVDPQVLKFAALTFFWYNNVIKRDLHRRN